MTVVNMFDFRPPSRVDDVPWTHMRVEESATGSGAGTQIEEKSLTTGPGLLPLGLDADPRYPMARDWSTSLATLPKGTGYYRVRFRDASNNTSEFTDWILDAPKSWYPTLREVAVHIRTRTVERTTNNFLGTFTDVTRPTDDEAWDAIDIAEADVLRHTGRLDLPAISTEGHRTARALIALRAAMIIERSFYPEQVGTNKSAYPGLERDWERQLPQLVEAIKEDLAGDIIPGEGDGGDGGPVATDSDHVVPGGSRVLSKTGTWLGDGDAQYTFPDDAGGMIGYGTEF